MLRRLICLPNDGCNFSPNYSDFEILHFARITVNIKYVNIYE